MAVAADGRILAVNQHFRELWQLADDDMRPGESSREIFRIFAERVADPEQLRAMIDRGRRARRTPTGRDLPEGRPGPARARSPPIVRPGGDQLGRMWFLRDETQRFEAERQRQELVERLHQARRAQEFLLLASDVLARATGYTETLERLAAVAVPTLGDLCLIDVLGDDGQVVRLAARHADPTRQSLADELRQITRRPSTATIPAPR